MREIRIDTKLAKARALLDAAPVEPARITKPSNLAAASDGSWADLLHEVTGRDVGVCPACGGRLESVAVARAPPAHGEVAA